MGTGARPRRSPTAGRFGLRLALWYAAVFVASSLAIILLTYALLVSVLRERDRQIVLSNLNEYSQRYAAAGFPALREAVEIDQRSSRQERLFVRVLRGTSETLLFATPPAWSDFDLSRVPRRGELWQQILSESGDAQLEVATTQLPDGTVLQVGKSSDSRQALLARFRAALTLVALAVVVVGLVGGAVITRSTLRPIGRLIDAVRTIIRTGKTDARVPVADERDAIDELSALFNEMLDRITMLIDGMGHALDNVAHDLRTPMTRLRGIAERALQAETGDAQREALVACVEESDRILSMLDTLMDISEAETGTMRLERRDTSVDALVSEVVELYEQVAEDKGVGLAGEVEPGLIVPADQARLRQVLANLTDNAIKYTPAGGEVTLRGRREGTGVRLEVADTGIGIPPGDLSRIWERLYRGDQSRAERGLGLGLSLVRAIVLAHGGTVDVDSSPGSGSIFVIRLPSGPPEGSITPM